MACNVFQKWNVYSTLQLWIESNVSVKIRNLFPWQQPAGSVNKTYFLRDVNHTSGLFYRKYVSEMKDTPSNDIHGMPLLMYAHSHHLQRNPCMGTHTN